MTKLLQDAIEMLKDLPEDRQDTVARAIINYSAEDDDALELTDDQVAEMERRIASPHRNFITLHELDKRLRRLRT
jgi:hypothetical protein